MFDSVFDKKALSETGEKFCTQGLQNTLIVEAESRSLFSAKLSGNKVSKKVTESMNPKIHRFKKVHTDRSCVIAKLTNTFKNQTFQSVTIQQYNACVVKIFQHVTI